MLADHANRAGEHRLPVASGVNTGVVRGQRLSLQMLRCLLEFAQAGGFLRQIRGHPQSRGPHGLQVISGAAGLGLTPSLARAEVRVHLEPLLVSAGLGVLLSLHSNTAGLRRPAAYHGRDRVGVQGELEQGLAAWSALAAALDGRLRTALVDVVPLVWRSACEGVVAAWPGTYSMQKGRSAGLSLA